MPPKDLFTAAQTKMLSLLSLLLFSNLAYSKPISPQAANAGAAQVRPASVCFFQHADFNLLLETNTYSQAVGKPVSEGMSLGFSASCLQRIRIECRRACCLCWRNSRVRRFQSSRHLVSRLGHT